MPLVKIKILISIFLYLAIVEKEKFWSNSKLKDEKICPKKN